MASVKAALSLVLPLPMCLLCLLCADCASSSFSSGGASPSPASRNAEVVNATIVENGCQSLGVANARLAERAMYELVEGCASIPGRRAQFIATLQPGGRIEISAGPGQPQVVPICVLKHSLVHKVPLTRPCGLNVKLEETTVSIAQNSAAKAP